MWEGQIFYVIVPQQFYGAILCPRAISQNINFWNFHINKTSIVELDESGSCFEKCNSGTEMFKSVQFHKSVLMLHVKLSHRGQLLLNKKLLFLNKNVQWKSLLLDYVKISLIEDIHFSTKSIQWIISTCPLFIWRSI